MIEKIDPQALPAISDNQLYLDYVSGKGAATRFFAHAPLDFAAALESRRGYPYPRQEIVYRLAQYNAGLGAHAHALQNVDALLDSTTFCVITGQQAGFLGGPAYTVYKIVTAIRLAEYLQENLQARFVPRVWLATEDHDFQEINHAYFAKGDGQKLHQLKLDYLPAFDGLVAAKGKLYMVTDKGTIVCLAGK